MTSVQRKVGVSFLHGGGPVSWGGERRYTCPSPRVNATREEGHEGPLLRLQVESYLDEHPEFLESYLQRKGDPRNLARILGARVAETRVAEAREDRRPPNLSINDEPLLSRSDSRKASEGSYLQRKQRRQSRVAPYSAECTPVLRRSISVTPHRKVSAATFESGCESPLLTTMEDGSVSFLTIPPEPRSLPPRARPEFLSELSSNGPTSNMPHLHDDLTSDLNINSLALKVAKNLRMLTMADSVSILQVKRTGQRVHLVPAALNVEENSLDEDCIEQSLTLEPDMMASLVELAKDGKAETYSGKELQGRFGEQSLLKDSTEQVVVLPLTDVSGETECLAILCLNTRSVKDIQDNRTVKGICRQSGICMKNASNYHSMRLEVVRSQVFLDLAKVILQQETSVEFTVLKILINFIQLIECERAQVQLFDQDLQTFQKSYDLTEADFLESNFESRTSPFENRFLQNSNIISLVAERGETVNIGDVSNDGRFDDNLNNDAHFEHRSLLCMPIRDSDQTIIGVVTLINKKTGCFTENDECFVEAFGVFGGISLANVSNLESVKQAEARSQVALEIMTYHASSGPEEALALFEMPVPTAASINLDMFSFTDTEMEDMDTLTASLRMFHDLDLVARFGLDQETLCRWLLTVKKNYRPEVTYHNWRHAFNVAQVMFSSLSHSGWWEGLGAVTCLGLIIGCLCHDLDHRGTNNTFNTATNSPLAKLYSTSTLERHHLNQALVILNLEGNQILSQLSSEEYSATLAVVEDAILATDLSLHFAHLDTLKALAAEGPAGLDWSSSSVVSTTTAALMTASDLGATTRPWETQQVVAGLVAEEFWAQGDLEREQLAREPIDMMNRDLRHQLPKLQVGFCDFVCLPVYRALATLAPALAPMELAVTTNRDHWAELAEQTDMEENNVRNV